MKIYFVTNEHYYSKIFRFLFKEPVSHVALSFFEDDLKLVIDATKPVGGLYHIKYWLSKYSVVYCMELKLRSDDEKKLCLKVIDETVMVPYDWGGYWFAFFVAIKKRLFGIPYPKKNEWDATNMRHCGEILESLKNILPKHGMDISDLDFAALTPHMAAQELYKRTPKSSIYINWPMGGPDGEVQAFRFDKRY